jgi:hypothetical protein
VARPQPPPWLPITQAPDLAREAIDSASRSLSGGNARDALRAAGWAWHHQRYLREAYEMGGRAAKEIGETELARALFAIVAEPSIPGPWLQAGWALVDQGWSDLAIPLLEEAHRIEPENVEARESLVIAYSDEGRHEEVVALASPMDLSERPSIAFPLTWSALMIRRLEMVERAMKSLAELAQKVPEVRGVHAKAVAAIERYREFPPEDDIRHWHYVQYGGITLDLCEDLDLAGGRYNLVSFSYERVASVLRRLVAVCDELEVPRGPWGFANRDGEILALALAALTGTSAVNGVPEGGWLVLGDPRDVDSQRDGRDLSAPGVRTFALTFPWMIWGPKVMDVTGLWVELAVLPWNGGWRQTGAGSGVREVPVDRRPAGSIAVDIVAAAASAATAETHGRDLLDFVHARRRVLTLTHREAPRGLPYVPDAPLPFASVSGVIG